MDLDTFWETPFWYDVSQYSPYIEIIEEKPEPVYFIKKDNRIYIKSLTTIVEEEINGSKKWYYWR